MASNPWKRAPPPPLLPLTLLKKGSGKDDAKVYECRFCSLKFCKSQALGGHMNRHRQERETETLNRARQLVFSTDGGHGSHIGLREMNIGGGGMQSISPGSFQHRCGTVAEQCLPLRPMYPRLPTQPYVYPSSSSSSSHHVPYPSPYPPHHPPVGDYFIGHVISGSGSGINSQRQAVNPNPNFSTSGGGGGGGEQSNYTCYGAPLPQNFPAGDRLPVTRESATTSSNNNNNNNNQGEGLGVNWTSNPSFVD
ncbi:putative transcription factor C2H2 family [Dioscorea sansibarensis]